MKTEKAKKDMGSGLTWGIDLLLYSIFDQRVKQLQLGSFSQGDNELTAFERDFFGTSLVATYLANIVDAYASADNFDRGNQFEKKDPMTALLWSALFPGLGQIYLGDNVFDGAFSILHSAYWLNKGMTGNSTEKTWGLGVFGLYYVIELFSYNVANAHNEKAGKLMNQKRETLFWRPMIDPLRQRAALSGIYIF